METTAQYVDMMIASLNKKMSLLDEIVSVNEKMRLVTAESPMDMEEFRIWMDKKDACVQQINQLDNGFQTIFDRIKDAIQADKSKYREQILTMQQQIRQLTDRSVQIETQEAQLKLVIEGQFAKMHRENQTAIKGMHAAQNYHKSMSGMHIVDAQFMDKKH